MRTRIVAATFVGFLVISVGMAQSRDRANRSERSRSGSTFFGHFLRNQTGIFPISSRSSGFGLGLSRPRSRSLSSHGRSSGFRRLQSRSGSLSHGLYRTSFLTWPSWNYAEQPSDTDHFVATWQDRDPFEDSVNSGFSGSALLREGMSEEEVVQAVGSPAEKIRLGPREIWKYSSYALVFQEGGLKEIR